MTNPLLKEPFFFVRHGETDWNQKQLCQGQKDIPLNEKGLLEARAFALEWRDFNIECIVSSPLTRALQTAQELHRFHPQAKLVISKELSERGWGELEGISSAQMYAIEMEEEQNPDYTPGFGVEPKEVFRRRVLSAIAITQNVHPNPWIISHGRVFLEICFALGMAPIRQISNCQLFKISPTESGWRATPLKK